MNILITGGLGYIGSNLIENLTDHKLTIVDNLYTQRYCTLFNPSTNFTFIEENFNNLTIAFLHQFDIVIHLAAIVDATNSFIQEDLVKRINFYDTQAFIYKCRQAKCKLIFPSSTSIYGISTDIVYEDNDSVLNPQSPYAEYKLKIENIIKQISDLDYVILRLGTISGISKGMRFQTCINKFCYQASFNQPITVWKNNLNLVRPYLSLTDINNVINNMLKKWNLFSKQTFNIVTQNLTLSNILATIQKYFSKDLQIKYTNCPLLNQFSYNVSINKIEKYGINISNNIEKDIEQTIKLLKNNKKQ